MAKDDEHVEAILEATEGQPKEDSGPGLSEWGQDSDQRAMQIDLLQTLVAVMVKANGGNPGKVSPAPRPASKFEEVRERRRISQHKKLVSRVMRRPSQVE